MEAGMSMKLTGMGSVRVETDWPCAIDVDTDSENLMAQICLMSDSTMRKSWMGQQVLVLLKERTLGIFVSPYPDSEPPEWWRDAAVLWRYDQIQPTESP